MIRACIASKLAGQVVTYHVLEDAADIPEFVKWIRSGKTFGLDSETTGLDWWAEDFRLRLVQFGNETEAYVLPVELGPELLGAAVGAIRDVIRRDGTFVLQNGTYDLLVLDATTDLTMEEVWPAVLDTKILAHLVDSRGEMEGGTGHSLLSLTKAYIDKGVAAKIKGSMTDLAKNLGVKKGEVFKAVDTFNHIYLAYSALDPILAFRLAKTLRRKVPSTARNLVRFEHEVAEVCSYMSRRGVKLNVEYTQALSDRLEVVEAEWTAKAQDMGCGNPWSTDQCAIALVKRGACTPPEALGTALIMWDEERLREYGFDAWVDAGLTDWDAYTKAGAIQLAETPSGKPKVDKKVLGELRAKGDELAEAIHQAKAARKKRNTWLKSFLEQVDANGYIHPSVNSIQARTARMSIQGVPAQTLPAGDWEIRNCFEADEGHIILSTDYVNMEMRFLAAESGDRRMLQTFKDNGDLHQITADAAGVDRKTGKMGGFLIVFGGGAGALVEQAGVTQEVAERVMSGFFESFPAVKRFMDNKTKEARRQGYVTTPSGRRLYVDRSRAYSGANYYIQSGSRDITCRALIRMHRAGLTPYMLLPVHDEVVFSIPVEHADKAMKLTDELMKETIKGLEIPTDPDRGGKSWGSLYMKTVETMTANDPYYMNNPQQAEIDYDRRNAA